MGQYSTLIYQSVDHTARALLAHFQSQYGKRIFIPLGISAKTPEKIALSSSLSVERHLLRSFEGEEKLMLVIQNAEIRQVYNDFMDGLYGSLSFVGKTAMKALGMRMYRDDLDAQLKNNKLNKPSVYEKRKENLLIILRALFGELQANLQQAGVQVVFWNEEGMLSSMDEGFQKLAIFQ